MNEMQLLEEFRAVVAPPRVEVMRLRFTAAEPESV